MGTEDLGSHYFATGNLAQAFKAYARMRDYCTSSKHVSEMCLKLILVSVEQGNWVSVQSNAQKIRNLNLKSAEEQDMVPKLRAVMGLAHMASQNYHEAALSFLQTDAGLGTSFNQVLAPNDIAVYGGLCALASMDRSELRAKVLESAGFRNLLELEPHIRRAVASFCNSKYSDCLAILDAYRTDYLLDLHLQQHVQPLYTRIRRKSIVQYFIPFNCVAIADMARAFKLDEQAMEVELVDMIQRGLLKARIDAQKRVSLVTKSGWS